MSTSYVLVPIANAILPISVVDFRSSLVPKELEATATPGKGVDVQLVDKQNEEYVAPAYVAYGGEGQTMGYAIYLGYLNVVSHTMKNFSSCYLMVFCCCPCFGRGFRTMFGVT